MKVGLDGAYIKAEDLGLTNHDVNQLHIGDIVANANGEFVSYYGQNKFVFLTTRIGEYLKNPYGPWYSLSNSKKIDTRTPIEKIKQWVFSNF